MIIGLALGWAAAGVVGGWLIEAVGFGALWLTGIVGALISAGMLATFLRGVCPKCRSRRQSGSSPFHSRRHAFPAQQTR